METIKEEHSKQQAKAQYESIVEMVGNLNTREALDNDSEELRESTLQTIMEDPLSVEVRSDWYTPGFNKAEATDYNILLCTGGPAVRIIGELNEYLEPETARIEHQDWGTPWTDYPLTSEQKETVLTYARCFWFGE